MARGGGIHHREVGIHIIRPPARPAHVLARSRHRSPLFISSASPSRPPRGSLLVRGHRRRDVPDRSNPPSFGARVAPSNLSCGRAPGPRPRPSHARRHPHSPSRVRHPPSRQPRASALARRRKRPGNPSPTPESASDVRRAPREAAPRATQSAPAIRVNLARPDEPRATQSYSREAAPKSSASPTPVAPLPRDDPRRGGVRLVATPRRIRSREGLARSPSSARSRRSIPPA